jgi:2-phosphosulfolactate phosphatase
MLRLELAFVPPGLPTDVAVVIDVLRMTTTATALFARGLEELAVVADTSDALELAERTGALLLGERHGVPLPGFHGGNSPLEHFGTDLTGVRAILCTTNGSKAVEAASQAPHVLLGAIVNALAVAERAVALAERSVLLLCAGTNGRPSLDDVLGAGCIAKEILRLVPDAELSDGIRIALTVADGSDRVEATLCEASHAETLRRLGFEKDIAFAAQRSSIGVVAVKVADEPARFRARL